MLRLATLHRGAQPAFYLQSSTKLERYSPQIFLLQKKDFERASMTGESCRKNLNILQAEAEKLSGFTPSIQPEVPGRGLYARYIDVFKRSGSGIYCIYTSR